MLLVLERCKKKREQLKKVASYTKMDNGIAQDKKASEDLQYY
jgi:hypothetical protein